MDWSKIGKFLVDNQDDIKKMAEDTAKAVRCANNLHEQHKKRKEENAQKLRELRSSPNIKTVNVGIFDGYIDDEEYINFCDVDHGQMSQKIKV